MEISDKMIPSPATHTIHELLVCLSESNAIEDEWDAQALIDSVEAWNMLIKHTVLTHDLVKESHRILMRTRHTIRDSEKGVYRNGHVYIAGRQGTTPKEIAGQMHTWIDRQNFLITTACSHLRTSRETAEFIADWSERILHEHVAYEIIHPFFDGNGRTGRMFMNWSRVQLGFPIDIIWERTKTTKYYPIFKGK